MGSKDSHGKSEQEAEIITKWKELGGQKLSVNVIRLYTHFLIRQFYWKFLLSVKSLILAPAMFRHDVSLPKSS